MNNIGKEELTKLIQQAGGLVEFDFSIRIRYLITLELAIMV
jgi:hypothetical protein